MNTPTPRTDAATYPADCLGTTLVTNRDCSRALETELGAVTGAYTCTHHNDQMRAACPVCLVATLTAERDQLRTELAEMQKSFAGNVHTENRVLQVELATERARLDYLGKCDGAFDHIRWGDYRHYWGKGFGSLREIVDAAMKEDAK